MRNPLLTNGQKTQPLSQWKRELRGLTFEREDVNYNILDANFTIKQKLTNLSTTPRRDYMRSYMKQKRSDFIPGLKVSELAKIKITSKRTVLNHLNKFDIITRTPMVLIKCNHKIFNWNPLRPSSPPWRGTKGVG